MFTKEELLQKGVPEEVADEIISSLPSEQPQEDSPVQALEKALFGDDPKMDDLEKARAINEKGEEGEDEEDDEDKKEDKYMEKSSKKMSKATEDISQVIDDMNMDADGAICEMTDLKPYLNSQNAFNEEMAKAVKDLADAINVISSKTDKNYDLMQKAAKVQLEQSKGLKQYLSIPEGRKGVVSTEVDMQKAMPVSNFSKEQNSAIYEKLTKAFNDGNEKAGDALAVFEANGHNANRLNPVQRKYINEIISKEGN